MTKQYTCKIIIQRKCTISLTYWSVKKSVWKRAVMELRNRKVRLHALSVDECSGRNEAFQILYGVYKETLSPIQPRDWRSQSTYWFNYAGASSVVMEWRTGIVNMNNDAPLRIAVNTAMPLWHWTSIQSIIVDVLVLRLWLTNRHNKYLF